MVRLRHVQPPGTYDITEVMQLLDIGTRNSVHEHTKRGHIKLAVDPVTGQEMRGTRGNSAGHLWDKASVDEYRAFRLRSYLEKAATLNSATYVQRSRKKVPGEPRAPRTTDRPKSA